MKPRVLKIGGSFLRNPGDLARAAEVIQLYANPVVVVSALFGVTDTLHRLAASTPTATDTRQACETLRNRHNDFAAVIGNNRHRRIALLEIDRLFHELERLLDGVIKLGEVPDFAYAKILSYGERLSAVIIRHALNGEDTPAQLGLPETIGLITDSDFTDASVSIAASTATLKKAVKPGLTWIIPGFYGVSPYERITLLGRGGSDYAAAAIARCLDAASLDIWKDVDGFMSSDPALVKDARPIPNLSYREAAELSYFGARILHPRTIEPLRETGTPIRIFNWLTKRPKPVSIINGTSPVDEPVIKSVTWSDDFGILRIQGAGVGIHPGILARVTESISGAGINIKSVITAQTAINVLVKRDRLDTAAILVRHLDLHAVEQIETESDIAVVAVVGEGIQERPGIAATMFGAMAENNINVRIISFGASPVAAYFVVDREERDNAVNAIHTAFFSKEVLA